MELKDIRIEIDEIDKQMTELFKRRMDCSRKVAEYKIENSLTVLNTERELAVLDKVEKNSQPYGASARLMYSTIMELSRALQHDMAGSGAKLKNVIMTAESVVPFESEKIRVACFGAEGAYSHKAAMTIFPNSLPRFYSPFKEVFSAVQNGQADFGIIPIENSSAGSVTAVYDLMLKYRFYIAAAADIPVRHCLAAKKDTKPEDIRRIYSHEQALLQCSDFLGCRSNIEVKAYISTAQAAKMVSESDETGIAAICSEDAAKKYGLEVLQRGFQNDPDNCTRFIVISKKLYITDSADKISLCFALPHVTGSLYSILCRFAAHGLNLTKIESRPINGRGFEYFFYLDFTGSTSESGTRDLLCALSEEITDFSFLGNYREFTEGE